MINVMERLGLKAVYLNKIKALYNEIIANIMQNEIKLKIISLISRTR